MDSVIVVTYLISFSVHTSLFHKGQRRQHAWRGPRKLLVISALRSATESCGNTAGFKQGLNVTHSWLLELLMDRKWAGKMRSVSQKKNRSDFTTLHTGCLRLSHPKEWAGKPSFATEAIPHPAGGNQGDFPNGKGFPKKFSQCTRALLPPQGKGCLLDQVRQRQARADVALEPAALPQERPPPRPAAAAEEAVHGLPAMGSLLTSLSQAIWDSNINKNS